MRVAGEKKSGETYNLIASIIALFMPNWKLYRLFFDTSKNLALSLSLSLSRIKYATEMSSGN